MKSIGKLLSRILRFMDEKFGVSTVEYALIVVAVVGIVGGSAALMSDAFTDLFTDLQAELSSAVANVSQQVTPGTPSPSPNPAPQPAPG